MPKYLPLRIIRTMTYQELERWWEVDFEVLCSTVVAEATGEVHASVREALCSDDWIDQWADALYAAYGALASATERMLILNDDRLEKNKKEAGQVNRRRGEVNRLVNAKKKRQGITLMGKYDRDAHHASLSIIVRQHENEYLSIRERIYRKHNLPNLEDVEEPYADNLQAVEHCVSRGYITAPLTQEVEYLLSAQNHVLADIVGRDVVKQDDRCDELRHPLLLRKWRDGLAHLRDRHCELAGLPPLYSVDLPTLDVNKILSMRIEEARTIINRRRFIRSIAQRHRECQMYIVQLSRLAAIKINEHRKPWHMANQEARDELGHRHQDELDALTRGLALFCVPGTTEFDLERFAHKDRKEAIRMMKEALRDGTWKNL